MSSQKTDTRNSSPPTSPDLLAFWDMPRPVVNELLQDAISRAHTWHYTRNPSYRQTVSRRGIGEQVCLEEFPRLLRHTAQTFKSYIDLLGSPFPQDHPLAFLQWLEDQLSIELPVDRLAQFKPHYASLEALLADIEATYADYGFEILTSSGTSGRSTIMVRDRESVEKTVESFYLTFQRYFKMQADHRAIFIMPQQTRIAMVRMATFSFRQVGLAEERVHYTIPFPAYPDQVRIRAGRTYRDDTQGVLERRILHPFMNWMNENYAMPRAIRQTLELLKQSEAEGDKVLLFGGWIQLHSIALSLLAEKRIIKLAPGSLLGTGGGFKEHYPYGPQQIRQDLSQTVRLVSGKPPPLRDVYGMAEGNWAAMQCERGNYHIPPWIFAVVLDEDDRFITTPQATGLLAFYDPLGGGRLFPAFFKTADQVTLVNGNCSHDPQLNCPCGESGAYLLAGSIQRVDLIDEAGCAAQI